MCSDTTACRVPRFRHRVSREPNSFHLALVDSTSGELALGPDGNLYIVSQNTDAVLRFDAETGNALGDFIPSGSGGLDRRRTAIRHGRISLCHQCGRHLTAPGDDSILRYDAVTGAPAGISGLPGDAVFIASGNGGLDNPSHIVFHNGAFYVASTSPST